jgi:hypothetical protein
VMRREELVGVVVGLLVVLTLALLAILDVL